MWNQFHLDMNELNIWKFPLLDKFKMLRKQRQNINTWASGQLVVITILYSIGSKPKGTMAMSMEGF